MGSFMGLFEHDPYMAWFVNNPFPQTLGNPLETMVYSIELYWIIHLGVPYWGIGIYYWSIY
jgi:hypothetical protein